eukprot:gene11405-8116_t
MWLVVWIATLMACEATGASSWIDPDTPLDKRRTAALGSNPIDTKRRQRPPSTDPSAASTRRTDAPSSTADAEDEDEYELVFSDEFNVDGRVFHDGFDPKWTVMHKDDYTNYALQYYNGDMVRTSNGFLNISTVVEDIDYLVHDPQLPKPYRQRKHYQSGMVQGWDKFCFTGGVIEIAAQLPGEWHTAGLWPAMWLMGNLARATYVASSNNVWPWSYDVCSPEHLPYQTQQLVSACNRVQHFGMHAHQGRGAPEIDILEAMAGNETLAHTSVHRPYFSASYQVAPGKETYRPATGWRPDASQWYGHDVAYGPDADLNIFFYGQFLRGETASTSYVTDALSANRNLYATHYERTHVYRLEWQLADDDDGDGDGADSDSDSDGPRRRPRRREDSLSWYVDDELVYHVSGAALNETQATLPHEPMYLILNTAISATWGFPTPCPADQGCPCNCYDCRDPACACALPPNMCSLFPAAFLVDYVRVYQNPRDARQHLGCSPPRHPTRRYIDAKRGAYQHAGDSQPLLPIQRGGGACDSDADCGMAGRCVAPTDWATRWRRLTGGAFDAAWLFGAPTSSNPQATVNQQRRWARAERQCACGSTAAGVAFTGPFCQVPQPAAAARHDADDDSGAVYAPSLTPALWLLLALLFASSAGVVLFKHRHDRRAKAAVQRALHPSRASHPPHSAEPRPSGVLTTAMQRVTDWVAHGRRGHSAGSGSSAGGYQRVADHDDDERGAPRLELPRR